MTYTNEMRPLSAMEIDFVAGGTYHGKPSSGNTIIVAQSNKGNAVALGLFAVAANVQVNAAAVVNESSIYVRT